MSNLLNAINDIVINFPVLGVDNSSQGFRDNYSYIKNSLLLIDSEIEDLKLTVSNIDLITLPDTGVTPGNYFGFTVDGKGRLTDAWNPLPSPTIANTILSWDGTTYQWIQDIDNFTNLVTSVNGDIGDVIVSKIYQGNSSVQVADAGLGQVLTTVDNTLVMMSSAGNTEIGTTKHYDYWMNWYSFRTSLINFNTEIDPDGFIYRLYGIPSEGMDGGVLVKFSADGGLIWSKELKNQTYLSPIKVLYESKYKVLVVLASDQQTNLYLLSIDPESGMLINEYLIPSYDNNQYADIALKPSTNNLTDPVFIISYHYQEIQFIYEFSFNLDGLIYQNYASFSECNFRKVKYDSNQNLIALVEFHTLTDVLGPGFIKYNNGLATEIFSIYINSTISTLIDFCIDNNNDIYGLILDDNISFAIIKFSGTDGSIIWQKRLSSISNTNFDSIAPIAIANNGNNIFIKAVYINTVIVLQITENGVINWQNKIDGLTSYGMPADELNATDSFLLISSSPNLVKYPNNNSISGLISSVGLTLNNFDLVTNDDTFISTNGITGRIDLLTNPVLSIPSCNISEISKYENNFSVIPFTNTNIYQLNLSSSLVLENGVGEVGQVLTSNGPGLVPSWRTNYQDVMTDNNTIIMTTTGLALKPVGVSGAYYSVGVDSFGRVTSGTVALTSNDIPDLDWSKIVTGKPTTLAGYGITNAVSTTSSSTISGNLTVNRTIEKALSIASTSIDVSSGSVFYKTISGATSFTFINASTSGNVYSFILEVTNPGTNITWPSSVKWAGGVAPTLTTTGVDILGFYTYDAGVTWRGLVLAKDSN